MPNFEFGSGILTRRYDLGSVVVDVITAGILVVIETKSPAIQHGQMAGVIYVAVTTR